jgi:hypothetical protein
VGPFPLGQNLVDKLVDKTAPVGLVDSLVDNKYNKKWQKIKENTILYLNRELGKILLYR